MGWNILKDLHRPLLSDVTFINSLSLSITIKLVHASATVRSPPELKHHRRIAIDLDYDHSCESFAGTATSENVHKRTKNIKRPLSLLFWHFSNAAIHAVPVVSHVAMIINCLETCACFSHNLKIQLPLVLSFFTSGIERFYSDFKWLALRCWEKDMLYCPVVGTRRFLWYIMWTGREDLFLLVCYIDTVSSHSRS